MIVKDHFSGLLRVYTLPDMTLKSASKGYMRWAHSYGIAADVRTDGGPSFGSEFTLECHSVGTQHIKSSAYNAQSNGCAEKGVAQIKGLLEKIGKKNIISQDELNKLVFKLNSNVNQGGSALQKFFGRDVGTYQPSLMRKKINHAALMQKKMDHQLEVAKKLGRRSADEFKEGDAVVAQNIKTGLWNIRGTLKEGRVADDGTTKSWLVETETGNTTLRNNRHLKHQVKKNVKFADSDASADTSADEEENDPDECLTTNLDKSENRFGTTRVSARLLAAALRKHSERA